nr:MAG TPA: hypothetical protein [Caudoviricetes sp.]
MEIFFDYFGIVSWAPVSHERCKQGVTGSFQLCL